MRSKVSVQEVSYTRPEQSEIRVGDTVIACVTGMGRGDIHVGIYRGLYPDGGAALDVQSYARTLVHKDTDEEYDVTAERQELPYPSYYDDKGNYIGYDDGRWKQYRADQEERRKDYVWVRRPYTWRTKLQNNKMWLLNEIAENQRL